MYSYLHVHATNASLSKWFPQEMAYFSKNQGTKYTFYTGALVLFQSSKFLNFCDSFHWLIDYSQNLFPVSYG